MCRGQLQGGVRATLQTEGRPKKTGQWRKRERVQVGHKGGDGKKGGKKKSVPHFRFVKRVF